MTNREKMAQHILKAERLQALIEAKEDLASQRAATEYPALPPDYGQKRVLDDDFRYKSLCGNRDGQQQQAIMYGIAALLEAVGFPQVER